MKAFVAPLAVALLVATAVTAQAFPAMIDGHDPSAPATSTVASDTINDLHRQHPCVGLSSGTAHHSCGGTATGGPVGGLI